MGLYRTLESVLIFVMNSFDFSTIDSFIFSDEV